MILSSVKTIAKFLRGEIAPLDQIHPYLISLVYAMDRAEAKDKLYRWLNRGELIILNRYATSNMAHQSGRLPKKEINEFLRWLDELEYKVNNIPREDIVLYLHVPYAVSIKLMQNEDRGNRSYNEGQTHDLVEKDKKYLQNSEMAYERLSKKFSHWVKIECVENGEMKSREQIHQEILTVLRKKHILDF